MRPFTFMQYLEAGYVFFVALLAVVDEGFAGQRDSDWRSLSELNIIGNLGLICNVF